MIAEFLCVLLASQVAAADADASVSQDQIEEQLKQVCRFDLAGHPSSVGAFVHALQSENNSADREALSWDIPVYVDSPTFARNGVDLDHALFFFPYELRAKGISRRSALRSILDSFGTSYYIGDGQLVITTKSIARTVWLTQLKKPDQDLLRSGTLEERRDAAFAAGFWSLDAETWVEPLVNSLQDDDPQVVYDAVYALGEFGPSADAAIAPLLDTLSSSDLTIRDASVAALAKIGQRCTPQLLDLINDGDKSISIAAIRAIGMMGHPGKSVVPSLVEIGKLRETDKDARLMLSASIALLDPYGSVSSLRRLMKDANPDVRAFAISTLGAIGQVQRRSKELFPSIVDITPEISNLLKDENTEVRRAAATALWQIDIPRETPVRPLEAATKDEDSVVRHEAGVALHRLMKKRVEYELLE